MEGKKDLGDYKDRQLVLTLERADYIANSSGEKGEKTSSRKDKKRKYVTCCVCVSLSLSFLISKKIVQIVVGIKLGQK